MGIMNDIGVLDGSNNLTDNAWKAYVDDVKKKIAKGSEGSGFPVPCAPKQVEPNEGAKMLPLEDKELFPEFYSTWHPRYEQMARDLNAEGAYNLAKTTGLPIVDPTAMATTLGMPPPPSMSFEDAIGHIITPPASPAELFEVMGVPPEDIANPVKLAEMTTGLMEAIAVPPMPPLGLPADPVQFAKIEEFGYTEWYAYEKDLLLTPVKTYTELLGAVTEIPNMLGNIPNGLVETVCSAAEPSQPKRMETSSTEEAASQTLKEHQVKLQSCNFLGTNIGSGAVTKGVAEGPLEVAKPVPAESSEDGDGPPQPVEPQSTAQPEESEEEVDYSKPPADGWGDGSGWPSEAPNDSSSDASSEGANYGGSSGGPLTPRRSLIINKIEKEIFTHVAGGVKGAYYGNKEAGFPTPSDGAKKVAAVIGSSGMWGKGTVGTSCGSFPPWVFHTIGVRRETDKNIFYGSINPFSPGPTIYLYWGVISGTWVWAWGPGKGNKTPTGKLPKPGDVFCLSKNGGGDKGKGGDMVTMGGEHKPLLKELCELTPDAAVVHVGVVISFDPATKMFKTADFGQKPFGGGLEGGCYRDRKMEIEPGTGRWRCEGETRGDKSLHGTRYLLGWIDIDAVPVVNPAA